MLSSVDDESKADYDEDDIAPPIQSVISKCGQPPLAGTSLANQPSSNADPDTILAMVLDVMIKSRPISHDLAQKTLTHLVDAGYHHIDILSSTTWEERTKVLSEGGYNRYREQCATNLGGLADSVSKRYGTFLGIHIPH